MPVWCGFIYFIVQVISLKATSSANQKSSVNCSPSILTSLSSMGSFLKIASVAAVNTFGGEKDNQDSELSNYKST